MCSSLRSSGRVVMTPIQGFSGLFRALRVGVALPAAALVPMASALREQHADQGE